MKSIFFLVNTEILIYLNAFIGVLAGLQIMNSHTQQKVA